MTDRRPSPAWRRVAGALGKAALALVAVAVVWWIAVRATAADRSLAVHRLPGAAAPGPVAPGVGPAFEDSATAATPAAGPRTDTLRLLAWNIAHNRGDLAQGTLQNFRGGSDEVRIARLARIAAVIRDADADLVVLNEADFDAAWSGGLDHAETLARAAGYPVRVEQRSFDYGTLSFDFAFGNALLSRLPVDTVRPVRLPPHSRLEALVVGAKSAALVVVETGAGPVGVVPVHLEFRSEATRLAAVPVLEALQAASPPIILAGDFNTSPLGWPGAEPVTPAAGGPPPRPGLEAAGRVTALSALLDAGWRSPRALGDPAPGELTFPSPDPRRAIDWVLAEAPLRILEARVLHGTAQLSDHLPVLAVIEVR